MLLKFIFKQFSINRQVEFLKKKAIVLGTRMKDGRRIHIYMFRNLFVEVIYKNDNTDDQPEKVNMLTGLKSLNSYLEKEFKASF
jgi:hypothetical protein